MCSLEGSPYFIVTVFFEWIQVVPEKKRFLSEKNNSEIMQNERTADANTA